MKEISLTITAKSPLAIGRKKPGSVSEAAEFIPGSVIRGAIAGLLLRISGQAPESGDDFSRLFIDQPAAIFTNAYPTREQAQVLIVPSTAVSSKIKPGFLPKKKGVFDTVIDRFCAEQWGQVYNPTSPDGDLNDRVELFTGFYTFKNENYKFHKVYKRLLTRVGINRSRATSEEQILYSLEVINETYKEEEKFIPTTFVGAIKVQEEQLAQALTEFIANNGDRFRLGGSASRGLGSVKIEAHCTDFNSQIKPRVKSFNDQLQQRWQEWQALLSEFYDVANPTTNRTYFVIDLQSDAVLIDNWRRTTILTESMLSEFANVADPTLKLHTAYSSHDYISGWNAAWGLMKDADLVTTKGGVYLFSTENIEDWYIALENLEYYGIGERTTEGLGQIQVCNEFHKILWESPV